MPKIMLVEDDNNLREIYGARLQAEGFDIVSAGDGEEALAVAVRERPDLIISDVMMPKISGFDMLDILRTTPETRSTKIIMMTALSQAEDKQRAETLGADKYMVKSQVTLEDVVKTVHELIGGDDSSDSDKKEQKKEAQKTEAPAPAAPAPAPAVTPSPAPVAAEPVHTPVATPPPPAPATAPAAVPPAAATPVAPPAPAAPALPDLEKIKDPSEAPAKTDDDDDNPNKFSSAARTDVDPNSVAL